MTILIEANEVLLYQLKKSKSPILFMIIFFPIWLYFGSMFLIPLYQSVFLGATSLTPSEYYLAGMIGLILFIPLVIVIILSYFLNQLIITDKRVYIRRGVIGRTHIVNLSDIRSFQHVVSTGKNKSNHKIHFYLYDGEIIKTGELFITLYGLQSLLELLRDKFEGRGFTGQELKQMKEQNTRPIQLVTKTNYLALLILFSPFILALILTINHYMNR